MINLLRCRFSTGSSSIKSPVKAHGTIHFASDAVVMLTHWFQLRAAVSIKQALNCSEFEMLISQDQNRFNASSVVKLETLPGILQAVEMPITINYYCSICHDAWLLGPFHGVIAVTSVTHYRLYCCGHQFYIAIHQVSLLSYAACAIAIAGFGSSS